MPTNILLSPKVRCFQLRDLRKAREAVARAMTIMPADAYFELQKALQSVFDNLLYAIDVWATIGGLAPRGPYQAAYQWDDSVVVDTELQFSQDLQLVNTGIMSKVEWRMRNFKETEIVARQKIAEAQAEQPEDLFAGQGSVSDETSLSDHIW